MMPEIYLADALGAVGKPMMRVHTAGSVGGSTAIVASHLVHGGVFERVLTVAYEKQSESEATGALTIRNFLDSAGSRCGRLFRADDPSGYIQRSGAPNDIGTGRGEGPSGTRSATRTHLRMEGITAETVTQSPMLWDPCVT